MLYLFVLVAGQQCFFLNYLGMIDLSTFRAYFKNLMIFLFDIPTYLQIFVNLLLDSVGLVVYVTKLARYVKNTYKILMLNLILVKPYIVCFFINIDV